MKRFSKENAVSIKSIMRVENEKDYMKFIVEKDGWKTPHYVEIKFGEGYDVCGDMKKGIVVVDLSTGVNGINFEYSFSELRKSLNECFNSIDYVIWRDYIGDGIRKYLNTEQAA